MQKSIYGCRYRYKYTYKYKYKKTSMCVWRDVVGGAGAARWMYLSGINDHAVPALKGWTSLGSSCWWCVRLRATKQQLSIVKTATMRIKYAEKDGNVVGSVVVCLQWCQNLVGGHSRPSTGPAREGAGPGGGRACGHTIGAGIKITSFRPRVWRRWTRVWQLGSGPGRASDHSPP